MRESLKLLHHICNELNQKFNGDLLDQETLDDFIEDITEDWDSSYEQLNNGLQLIAGDLTKIDSSENDVYTKGLLDVFWGLGRLEVLLDDANALLVSLNKKFMYKSGEITLEEYLDDGILQVEYVDDADE